MFNFNKLAGIAARHIIQVLLQSSEAAQVTEIAITGKASGSNVDRLKMTVSWRLNVGHFSFYSFKLRLSLHVIVAITLCRFHLPSQPRFFGVSTQSPPPPPPALKVSLGERCVTSQNTAANESMLPLLVFQL